MENSALTDRSGHACFTLGILGRKSECTLCMRAGVGEVRGGHTLEFRCCLEAPSRGGLCPRLGGDHGGPRTASTALGFPGPTRGVSSPLGGVQLGAVCWLGLCSSGHFSGRGDPRRGRLHQ